MVSVLNSGLSGPGLYPGWGHCFVSLSKVLYSHSASIHPGVTCNVLASHPGGVAISQLQNLESSAESHEPVGLKTLYFYFYFSCIKLGC